MLYNRTDHNSVNGANQFAEYIENDRFFIHLYLSLSERLLYNINVSYLSYTSKDTSLIYG